MAYIQGNQNETNRFGRVPHAKLLETSRGPSAKGGLHPAGFPNPPPYPPTPKKKETENIRKQNMAALKCYWSRESEALKGGAESGQCDKWVAKELGSPPKMASLGFLLDSF